MDKNIRRHPVMSAELSLGSILPRKKPTCHPYEAADDDEPEVMPITTLRKQVRAIWLQPSAVLPSPAGEVFGYTRPDSGKPRGERYILPEKYKVSRPISPVWGNRQYRYPKHDATVEIRFVCFILNYIQRTELPYSEMAKNTLYKLQTFSRFVSPRDESVILHTHVMKANEPQFLGGCQELLEGMCLNKIKDLSALEVNITCSRNCRRDDVLQDYWLVYRIMVYVKLITDNGMGEDVAMKDNEGKDIAYNAHLDYSWDTGFGNMDNMAWSNVLEEIRNKAKCMFDSFGQVRSGEDYDKVRKKLLPGLSPFQMDMRAKYGVQY